MDVASALADLTEISSQVEAAAVVDADGGLLGSMPASEPATERLVQGGLGLLEAAASRFGSDVRSVTQVESALREGSLFAVRAHGLCIVARTTPGPPSGLVLYDLETCLRAVAETRKQPKPGRRPAKKAETADA